MREPRFRRARVAPLAALVAAALAVDPHAALGDRSLVPVPDSGALPANARSFIVDDDAGITLMRGPAGDAAIAGRSLPHAALPVLEGRAGPGCRRLWIRVAPDAWICGEHGALSPRAPDDASPSAHGTPEHLPWTYAFTAHDGARAYHTLDAAIVGSDDPRDFETWEANWGFATDATFGSGAERVVRTRMGLFLRRADLYRASPSTFAGGTFDELSSGAPGVPFGWVAIGGTRIYAAPAEHGPSTALVRFSRVHVYATVRTPSGTFARIGPDQFVRAEHLRWVTPAPPPREVDVRANERWIDVDLASQTLVAYEGAVPVYATLVSSGERVPTPTGVFRIWGRFLAHTMDNVESTHLPNHFRFGDVPYVQFFDHDRAFHAVYWHDGFGEPHSHGCINLSPRDAEFLFRFAGAPLPPGWVSEMIPPDRGTLVRIRGAYVPARDGA